MRVGLERMIKEGLVAASKVAVAKLRFGYIYTLLFFMDTDFCLYLLLLLHPNPPYLP